MTKKGSGTVLSSLKEMIDGCFIESDAWISIWLSRILLAGLFLIGLLNWSVFFNWGDVPLDIADWGDITIPRMVTLTDAVREETLPLHISKPDLIKGVTDRFLTIPDTILSPQILFLRFLQPGQFLYVNLLLLYTAGYYGLNLFRKKYHIGLAIFSLLFLLFNFNGHIVAHLTVGHATWMSYFLLPYFILLSLELFENKSIFRWVLKVVVLQVIILLQGGYHFFVWILFFLILLGITTQQVRKTAFITVAASVLASAFRILPASLLSAGYKLSFLGGFTTLHELIRGFIDLVEPAEAVRTFSPLNSYVGWWEFDYYIGWAGVIFIAGSIFLGWRKKIQISPSFKNFVVPGLVLFVISIGRLYKPIFMLQVPLLNGERVASRFLILPFLILLFAAAVYAQRLIEDSKPLKHSQILFSVLFFLVFNDLQQHFELWSPAQLEKLILPVALSASYYQLNNQNDPVYFSLLIAGGVISLLTLVVLIYLSFKNKTKKHEI